MAIPIQASDPDVQIFTDALVNVEGPWVAQLTCLTDITKIAFPVVGKTGALQHADDIVISIGTGSPGSEVAVIENIHWGDTDSAGAQGDRAQGWLIIPWFFPNGTIISARIKSLDTSAVEGYDFQLIAME